MESSRAVSLLDPSENDRTSARSSLQSSALKKKERSNFIDSIFCKGAPSSGGDSVSIYPSTRCSDKKYRTDRTPLRSTDVLNKEALVTPTNAACGFPDTVRAFLPSSKHCGCSCDGACVNCWDAHSTHLTSSRLQSPQDSFSIPAIEELGVTPKSKSRTNKYSTMNPPGKPIPTPAPVRHKYTPIFDNIPEALTTAIKNVKSASDDDDAYLPDDYTDTKENALLYTEADLRTKIEEFLAAQGSSQDSGGSTVEKQISAVYTEAYLNERIEEALASQEAELEMKYASMSEDSAARELQLQMQKQLEEQGVKWNEDLKERVDEIRQYYKQKQSKMKERIAELEQKCQSLEKSQTEEREAHWTQTEQLRVEMNQRQEKNDAERAKLLNEIAKQNERISNLTKIKAPDREESSCTTPGFIRELQQKVRALKAENDLNQSRENELKGQICGWKEEVSTLEKSLADFKDGHKLDQRKISELLKQLKNSASINKQDTSELEMQVQELRQEKASLQDDVTTIEASFLKSFAREKELEDKLDEKIQQEKELEEKLDDKTKQENKLKAGFQRCIRILSVRPDMDLEASTPFDESDWIDTSVNTLIQLVSKLSDQLEEADQRSKQAEQNVRKETDSRLAAELEVARLSDMLESRNSEEQIEQNVRHKTDSRLEAHLESARLSDALESRNNEEQEADSPSDEDLGVGAKATPLGGLKTVGLEEEETNANKITSNDNPIRSSPQNPKAIHKQNSAFATEGSNMIKSYLNDYTFDVLIQLKQDIESLRRIIAVRNNDSSNNSGAGASNEGQACVVPDEALDAVNELVEDIYVQLRLLQEQRGARNAPPLQVIEEREPIETTSAALDQLEFLRLALAKKEKEHVDEARKVQKLTEELDQLRSNPSSIVPNAESSRDLPSDSQPNEPANEASSVGAQGVPKSDNEIQHLSLKLAEAESNIARLEKDIATKEAKSAEIVQALGLSLEQQTLLENHLAKLLEHQNNESNEEATLIRSEIQGAIQRHFAENLNGDEKEVQELMVMLELKQKNEELTVQRETLEKQLSELTSNQHRFDEKVDTIISHIELVENEEALSDVEPISTPGDSTLELDKLDRIERHLQKIAEKNVEELTKQRQLLGTMKEHIAAHEIESQQTIEGLQGKITELESNLDEKRHESKHTIADLETKLEEQRHESQQTLQKLQKDLEEKRHQHQQKIQDLEKDLEESRHGSLQKIQELQTKIDELDNALENKQHELDVATSEMESLKNELSDALDAVSKASEASEMDFRSIVDVNEKMASLATEKEKLSHLVSTLETQVKNLTSEKELMKQSFEQQEAVKRELENARSESSRLEEELKASKAEIVKQDNAINELKTELETHRTEYERLDKVLQMRPSNLEEELLKRAADIEAKANATIKKCEEQVRQAREEHAKEIDELLSQLDLVEAEHTEIYSEKEKVAKDKDTIISALGSQLAESQKRITALEEASEERLRNAEEAKEELTQVKKELESLRVLHDTVLESERVKREEAIEEAREETIQEATAQFEHFNALYRTMTKNYKSAAARIEELEKELLASQNALFKLTKEHGAKVASLNSDMAEMKAEHAKADAEAKKRVKEYLDELEQVRSKERDLKTRLSEAESNSRSVQKLLATVVAEKEEIIAENEELKSVCEEAMSIAESTRS